MTAPVLTERERALFWSQGYAIFAGVVPTDTLAETRHIAERLVSQRAGRADGDLLDLIGDDSGDELVQPQLLMPVKYAPELAASPLRPVAWGIARHLLGDAVEYQGEHIIVKPPWSDAETPPHQDEAFWDGNVEYQAISIWIPLQPVDEDSGCMRFTSGSHRSALGRHRLHRDDPRSNSFELIDVPPLRSVPMRAGDISVHHCRTVHGACGNRRSVARYAYIYGFGLPPRPSRAARHLPWLAQQATYRQQRAAATGQVLTKMRRETAL